MYNRPSLVFLAVLLLTKMNAGSAADFRGLDWGATMTDVRAGERAKLQETGGDYVAYLSTFGGHDVLVVYYFDPDFGLNGADYGLNESYTNPEKYVDAFNDFGEALAAEFGEGDRITEWTDRSLEPEYEGKPGKALADGVVEYQRSWVSDASSVYLKARGEGGEILVSIHYYSTEFLEWQRKKTELPGPEIKKKTLEF
ncbi:MAG: hypothetical protein JSW52_03730 [Candidatus Coatesbacteria bacterium]|nr:MAG: hypothetical protein JSW52_03730 [Candidatus Coatesbacteria bacterium]